MEHEGFICNTEICTLRSIQSLLRRRGPNTRGGIVGNEPGPRVGVIEEPIT